MKYRRHLFAIAGVALSIALLHGPQQPRADAATELNEAALIIQTPTMVRHLCIKFPEESLSGTELLQRAKVGVVLRGFSGKGAAVCSMCNTGCPADGTCLTCGGNNYWSYSRAPADKAKFDYSPVGASSATVRNNDVEGWAWGPGGSPPYKTALEICESATTPVDGSRVTESVTPAPSGRVNAIAGSVAPSPSKRTRAGAHAIVQTKPSTTTTVPPATTPSTTAPVAAHRITQQSQSPGTALASTRRATTRASHVDYFRVIGYVIFAAAVITLLAQGQRRSRSRKNASS